MRLSSISRAFPKITPIIYRSWPNASFPGSLGYTYNTRRGTNDAHDWYKPTTALRCTARQGGGDLSFVWGQLIKRRRDVDYYRCPTSRMGGGHAESYYAKWLSRRLQLRYCSPEVCLYECVCVCVQESRETTARRTWKRWSPWRNEIEKRMKRGCARF